MFFAGQMTGVEGYVESAGSGLIAGINAANLALGKELILFPHETALGSMARYVTEANPKNFQPMNINFGLFPELGERVRTKLERAEKHAERALKAISEFQLCITILNNLLKKKKAEESIPGFFFLHVLKMFREYCNL